jgi:hypothetical protein
MVLPRPGTPSSSAWPPPSRQIKTPSTIASWPTIILPISSLIRRRSAVKEATEASMSRGVAAAAAWVIAVPGCGWGARVAARVRRGSQRRRRSVHRVRLDLREVLLHVVLVAGGDLLGLHRVLDDVLVLRVDLAVRGRGVALLGRGQDGLALRRGPCGRGRRTRSRRWCCPTSAWRRRPGWDRGRRRRCPTGRWAGRPDRRFGPGPGPGPGPVGPDPVGPGPDPGPDPSGLGPGRASTRPSGPGLRRRGGRSPGSSGCSCRRGCCCLACRAAWPGAWPRAGRPSATPSSSAPPACADS